MKLRVSSLVRSMARSLGWAGACVGALLTLAAGTSVDAQSTRDPLLQWTRARDALGCIDAHTLGLRVETLTGPRLGPPRDSNYLIEGQIARAGSGFVATLRVLGGSSAQQPSERTLRHDGANCRDFDEALTFVIALMIDPELDLSALIGSHVENPGGALLQELNAAPSRQVPAAGDAAPAPARATPVLAQRTRRGPVAGWRVLAGAGATTLDTPEPLVHFGVAGRRTMGRSLSLHAGVYTDSSVIAHGVGAQQLRLVRSGLGAGVCGERARRKDTFVACFAVSPELWLGLGRSFDETALAAGCARGLRSRPRGCARSSDRSRWGSRPARDCRHARSASRTRPEAIPRPRCARGSCGPV